MRGWYTKPRKRDGRMGSPARNRGLARAVDRIRARAVRDEITASAPVQVLYDRDSGRGSIPPNLLQYTVTDQDSGSRILDRLSACLAIDREKCVESSTADKDAPGG